MDSEIVKPWQWPTCFHGCTLEQRQLIPGSAKIIRESIEQVINEWCNKGE